MHVVPEARVWSLPTPRQVRGDDEVFLLSDDLELHGEVAAQELDELRHLIQSLPNPFLIHLRLQAAGHSIRK